MELFETVIIALQLTNIMAKKKYKSLSSEESIENILYYRDCNHKQKTTEAPVIRSLAESPPPQQQECKMCCTMCCGDDCVDHQRGTCSQSQPLMNGRSGGSLGSIQKPLPRQPPVPMQPPLRSRKKKFKQPLLPPIAGRRDFGFTRENIKSLISQDEDIKKILKDLVKVTMQKVDLVEMIQARRNEVRSAEGDDSENEDEL